MTVIPKLGTFLRKQGETALIPDDPLETKTGEQAGETAVRLLMPWHGENNSKCRCPLKIREHDRDCD